MKAILNHEILDWEEVRLSPLNRGFRYGDGFFETIAIIKGTPRFLDRHISRLQNGTEFLKLDAHTILNFVKIQNDIQALQKTNKLHENAKLKLYIWRNSGGLYTPVDGNTHYLMTIESAIYTKISLIKSAEISNKTYNYPSPASQFKTMSAMKYVIAGIEMKERKLDEIIIPDHQGFVSETLSSNLFWKKKDTYYTSPLSTGCIEGIMRSWLMNKLKQNGFTVIEKNVKPVELFGSDHIFTTNSMGIRHIQCIGRHTYEIDLISQKIIESIS